MINSDKHFGSGPTTLLYSQSSRSGDDYGFGTGSDHIKQGSEKGSGKLGQNGQNKNQDRFSKTFGEKVSSGPTPTGMVTGNAVSVGKRDMGSSPLIRPVTQITASELKKIDEFNVGSEVSQSHDR